MLNYSEKLKVEFLILNDLDIVDISPLTDFVSKYMDCTVYDTNHLCRALKHDFDSKNVYAVGAGGKRVLRNPSIDIKKFDTISIKRIWKDGKPLGFSNIGDVKIKEESVLVDDIIGSGETLHFINSFAKSNDLEAVSLVMNNNPNDFKDENGVKGYKNTTCTLLVEGSGNDSYWYPAIYSLRHLLFKPKENPWYLRNMAQHYFENNLNGLEGVVKRLGESNGNK